MARIHLTADQVIVEIEGWHRLWALKRGFRIPLAHVRGVTADPGAASPRGYVRPVLTFRHPGRRDLLQPQAQRLLDVLAAQIHDQIAEAVRSGGITLAQQVVVDAAVEAAVVDFRARRPIDTSAMPPSLVTLCQQLTGVNERFVRSDDQIDPAVVARHLRALGCRCCSPAAPRTATCPVRARTR